MSRNGGEIARAVGVGGVPTLLVGLVTSAVLGPVGSGLLLTGSAGLEGYADGLVGALVKAGVDVSNSDEVVRALKDERLMERARDDAGRNSMIEMGATAISMMVGVRRRRTKGKGDPQRAERVAKNRKKGLAFEDETAASLKKVRASRQVSLRVKDGTITIPDFLTIDHRKKIGCVECKAGKSARLSKKQKRAFPQIAKGGALIVKGGTPDFPNGTRIPPTKVEVRWKR